MSEKSIEKNKICWNKENNWGFFALYRPSSHTQPCAKYLVKYEEEEEGQ